MEVEEVVKNDSVQFSFFFQSNWKEAHRHVKYFEKKNQRLSGKKKVTRLKRIPCKNILSLLSLRQNVSDSEEVMLNIDLSNNE